MSYRSSNKRRLTRKRRILTVITALVIGLITLWFFGAFSQNISSTTGSVVETGEEARSLLRAIFTREQDLIEENERLTRELDQLRLDNGRTDEILARNQELLRILGREIAPEYIVAGVVKRPPFSPYDIYTIDAGSENGVSVGNIVQYSDFVALGRVTDVNPTASKVQLYSSPRTETQVFIAGEPFTAIGSGGGTLRVRAARDAEIAVGDELILPGYQMLSIGVVRDIIAGPQDSFADVRAISPVNVQAVDLVRVSETLDLPALDSTNSQIQNETTEISDIE